MNTRSFTHIALSVGLSLGLFTTGCTKKAPIPIAAATPQPEPVAPKAPEVRPPVIALFTAEPSSIEKGRSATLRWEVSGANNVSINQGLGTVSAKGSREVYPGTSTTYLLSASNEGGTASASASVNVTNPPPPVAPPPVPSKSLEEVLTSRARDAFFDFDKFDLRPDARDALSTDAEVLKFVFREFPNASLVLEGHCDDRGSAEYNLALGDRRAHTAKEYLTGLGVDGGKLKLVSYGKERPQCSDTSEDCRQKNRRAHLAQ